MSNITNVNDEIIIYFLYSKFLLSINNYILVLKSESYFLKHEIGLGFKHLKNNVCSVM